MSRSHEKWCALNADHGGRCLDRYAEVPAEGIPLEVEGIITHAEEIIELKGKKFLLFDGYLAVSIDRLREHFLRTFNVSMKAGLVRHLTDVPKTVRVSVTERVLRDSEE